MTAGLNPKVYELKTMTATPLAGQNCDRARAESSLEPDEDTTGLRSQKFWKSI